MLETRPTSLSEAFAALAADMRADARWMVRAHAFNPVERLRALVLLALADLVATLAAFIADWEATRHLPAHVQQAEAQRAQPQPAQPQPAQPRNRAPRARATHPRRHQARRRPHRAAIPQTTPTPQPRPHAPTPRAPHTPRPTAVILRHIHPPARCREITVRPQSPPHALNVP